LPTAAEQFCLSAIGCRPHSQIFHQTQPIGAFAQPVDYCADSALPMAFRFLLELPRGNPITFGYFPAAILYIFSSVQRLSNSLKTISLQLLAISEQF
jgi:hypothetical protein